MHVIKPNNKKVFFVFNLKVLSTTVILIFFLTVLNVFYELGDSFQWIVLIVILLAASFLLLRYISLLSVSYKFMDSQLKVRRPFLIIFRRTKKIPYHGISHVKKKTNGFFDSMLNTGTITMDVSAVGEKELRLTYMDDPAKVVQDIKEAMRSHNVKTQTEYTERYRLKKELKKSGL